MTPVHDAPSILGAIARASNTYTSPRRNGSADCTRIPSRVRQYSAPKSYATGLGARESRLALWAFISFQAWRRVCGASQCSLVAS